jgi:hypothetical protein
MSFARPSDGGLGSSSVCGSDEEEMKTSPKRRKTGNAENATHSCTFLLEIMFKKSLFRFSLYYLVSIQVFWSFSGFFFLILDCAELVFILFFDSISDWISPYFIFRFFFGQNLIKYYC